MRKHPIIGVLALALVLLASGAFTVYAGNQTVRMGANGECCTLVNGVCVPCDCPSGASSGAAVTPARFATARFAGAKSQLASAGCDPSNCEPMTPEQCAALGCDPGQCAGSSGCSTGARMIDATAKSQLVTTGCAPSQCATTGASAKLTSTKASGCGSAPCAPSPGCGTGSGCKASAAGTVNAHTDI